jgi:trehalose-6-phosphatase
VEVHQFGVSKATAVSLIIHHLNDHVGIPDFALYAGDDESDEVAFRGTNCGTDIAF